MILPAAGSGSAGAGGGHNNNNNRVFAQLLLTGFSRPERSIIALQDCYRQAGGAQVRAQGDSEAVREAGGGSDSLVNIKCYYQHHHCHSVTLSHHQSVSDNPKLLNISCLQKRPRSDQADNNASYRPVGLLARHSLSHLRRGARSGGRRGVRCQLRGGGSH